jgi:hypothetical protein
MEKTLQWVLTTNDRCDYKDCSAQAYVSAKGVSGELLFCSHHYESIVNNAVGYDKIMKFAFNIVDERERLSQNRSKDI